MRRKRILPITFKGAWAGSKNVLWQLVQYQMCLFATSSRRSQVILSRQSCAHFHLLLIFLLNYNTGRKTWNMRSAVTGIGVNLSWLLVLLRSKQTGFYSKNSAKWCNLSQVVFLIEFEMLHWQSDSVLCLLCLGQ